MKPWMGAIVGAMFPLFFIAMTWLSGAAQERISYFVMEYVAPALIVVSCAACGFLWVSLKKDRP